MYLTRVQLDPTKRNVMRAMAFPNLLHGAIESAFSGERQHPLWRLDRLGGKDYLLILSERSPDDLSELVSQFGAEGAETKTKDYSPLLERIKNGTRWHFRLTANPTRSAPQPQAEGEEKRPRGKVYAHVTIDQQKKWLLDRTKGQENRTSQYGFQILEHDPDGAFGEDDMRRYLFDITQTRWYRFGKREKGKKLVTLHAATFEGTLVVTDAEAFRRTLCNGIGRGKAYGMGLMTVVRCYE